jgi:isopentenyl diphosphate isomerase/L-lactate dehydrogenase-like FMN-dependent dehydrogenase
MPAKQNQFKNRKHLLGRAGVTYYDVARLADVSWNMVWRWMHGQRTSARVQAAFDKLTDGHRAA